MEQLATNAKSSFVLLGADRRDPQWEWSYALINSAYVPGMCSVEVVGEEHLLAAANSTDTDAEEASTPARLLGDAPQHRQPQLQQLAQAAWSTAEVAPGLSTCNPDFAACSSQTKS